MLHETLNLLKPSYAILDSARIFGELNTAKKLQANFLSLFKDRSEEILSSVAPYLFPYKTDTEFGHWLMDKGWGNAWGIYIVSPASMDDLHKHFRKFLMVQTEDGQELYFRFYDPRVLRNFLPTCDPMQLSDFFGPIAKFIVEDKDPNKLLVFEFDGSGLKIKSYENVAENKEVNEFGYVYSAPGTELYRPNIPTPEQQILAIQAELKGKIDIPNPFANQPVPDESMLMNEVNRGINTLKPDINPQIPNEQTLESSAMNRVNAVKPNTNINTPNVKENTLEQKLKSEALNNKPDTSKIQEMERLADNADPERKIQMIGDDAKLKAEQKAREEALKPVKKKKFNPLD